MPTEYLVGTFKKHKQENAIVWEDDFYTYDWLLNKYNYWEKWLLKKDVAPGACVAIEADFSPNSICLLIALIKLNAIIVPLTDSVKAKKEEFLSIACCESIVEIDKEDSVVFKKISINQKNTFIDKLRKRKHPGLILFSSGSTGKSKAAIHDLTHLLNKFKVKRHSLRTVTFLLYDHIGGFNTLFYILSNAGLVITLKDRSPNKVLEVVEKYKVELLPTSPTFLNLMLISEAYKNYNLDSLKIISYGTEPMPESTLKQLNLLFPNIKFQQTYGLSEVGILRSKSYDSDSLWVKIGGEGFKTRIVNGKLEIKSESAMLGYLNAPNPFTKDGWFKTGDLVESRGDYIKILGRESEIINVGGEKFYPQEVESIILELNEIEEVLVYPEKNPIMGNIVCAKVKIRNEADMNLIKKSIKNHCHGRLEKFKVPLKIKPLNSKIHSDRYKKTRNNV